MENPAMWLWRGVGMGICCLELNRCEKMKKDILFHQISFPVLLAWPPLLSVELRHNGGANFEFFLFNKVCLKMKKTNMYSTIIVTVSQNKGIKIS